MQIPFRLGHAMEWYKFIVSVHLRMRAPRIGQQVEANAGGGIDRVDR